MPAECLDEADQVLVFDGKGNVSARTNTKQEEQRRDLLEVLQQPAKTKPAASDASDMSTKDAQQLAKASSSAEVVDFRGVSKVALYGMLLRSMGIWWFCLYLVMQMVMSALELIPGKRCQLFVVAR